MARVCQLTDDLKYYLCMEASHYTQAFRDSRNREWEFGRYLTQDEAFIFYR